MEPNIKESISYAQKWTFIEYIKSWVDEMYSNEDFYSFSLNTLNLTREFRAAYQAFQESNTEPGFLNLYALSEKLENRLKEEENL